MKPGPKSLRTCLSDCFKKYGDDLPNITYVIIIASLIIAVVDVGVSAASVAAILAKLGYGNASLTLTTCLVGCLRKKRR